MNKTDCEKTNKLIEEEINQCEDILKEMTQKSILFKAETDRINFIFKNAIEEIIEISNGPLYDLIRDIDRLTK